MVTYICTVGTSICTSSGMNLAHFAKMSPEEWDNVQEDVGALRQLVLENIRNDRGNERSQRCAEINSLVKMGISPEDRVILLATETIEGRASAEIVREALLDGALCSSVTTKVIEGLQAQDGIKFRLIGVKNLIAEIARYENEDVVFNPTGGLKSEIGRAHV